MRDRIYIGNKVEFYGNKNGNSFLEDGRKSRAYLHPNLHRLHHRQQKHPFQPFLVLFKMGLCG